jgi:hypothetical protein
VEPRWLAARWLHTLTRRDGRRGSGRRDRPAARFSACRAMGLPRHRQAQRDR